MKDSRYGIEKLSYYKKGGLYRLTQSYLCESIFYS